ncbi:MAG: hypothetical protein GF317_12120 [Candidatus Lokiarchaeota archaeon]|nr:hypothetical protein [Candidatus Lokiarchaeota archaeon]MBD3200390.1 hypothetical protein [Candidatus Lokiarchaeota archaeon]
MCRMLIYYSNEPKSIPIQILSKFIKSCHWDYFKKYDLVGHHGAGWGIAYIPSNSRELIVKRTLTPIYRSAWKNIRKIKSRFILIHARKTLFGEKKLENVHPIDIGAEYCLTHNGTIKMDSFPTLNDKKLERIKNYTDLDTRRYLCTILDQLKSGNTLKNAIKTVLQQIRVSSAANAFLFNSNEVHIIKYQNNTINGRHTTLFIDKSPERYLISTTPITSNALEIPNRSLISIPFIEDVLNEISFSRLNIGL